MAHVDTTITTESGPARGVHVVDCDVHAQATEPMLAKYLSAPARRLLGRYGRRTPRITEWYPRARNAGMRVDAWPVGLVAGGRGRRALDGAVGQRAQRPDVPHGDRAAGRRKRGDARDAPERLDLRVAARVGLATRDGASGCGGGRGRTRGGVREGARGNATGTRHQGVDGHGSPPSHPE